MPAAAEADWYFTPFYGWDFKGTTTLVDFEYGGRNRSKPTFGGSVLVITGIVGVEADYAFVPGFFQNPDCGSRPVRTDLCPSEEPVVSASHVQTFTGSVVLAAPLSLTRESLRPYVVAGLGWMDASSAFTPAAVGDLFSFDRNLVGLNLGVGAIGMLGNRAGLRFDLRRFSNIDRSVPSGTELASARLKLWRATVGVTLRY